MTADAEPCREDFDEITLGPADVLVLRPRSPVMLSANYVDRLNERIPARLKGRVLVIADDLYLAVVRNAASSSPSTPTGEAGE